MTRHRTAFCLLAAVVCGLSQASHARAYDEQASLDLASGYTQLAKADSLPAHGVELSVGGSYGLGDMFVLRGALGYAPMFDDSTLEHTGRLRLEAAYLLDVLQFVPFFGLGASLWLYDDQSAITVRPAAHVLLGVDYLFSRLWVFGLDVRTGILSERSGPASVTEVQVRFSRMFELF